jgi:hypothetical protein
MKEPEQRPLSPMCITPEVSSLNNEQNTGVLELYFQFPAMGGDCMVEPGVFDCVCRLSTHML